MLSFLLAPGALLRGGGKPSLRNPLGSQRASAAGSRPPAHPGCGARPSARALRAARGPEPPRGASPSGGAAQPLRPPASGRRDPGGSGQARTTIPACTGLELSVRGVAVRVPPSPGGIVRAWAEIETKAHSQWGRLQFPPPRPQFKKIKLKPNALRMPARPPPAAAAVQPRPGGAAPAPGRARTSPPSMKLSGPHSETGVPPGQWDRGSRAGARGARPLRGGSRGGRRARTRRARPHSRRRRAQTSRTPPAPRTFKRSFALAPRFSTATASRRPSALLRPVVLQQQKPHLLASWPQGVPLSLPQPRESLRAPRALHRRSTGSSRGGGA